MKSISNQILVGILISLSIVFGGCFFYGIHSIAQFETDRLEQNNIRACERLVRYSVKPILNNDLNSIMVNVNVEASDENIRSIQILDQNNELYGGVVRLKGSLHAITGNQLHVLHQDSIVKQVLHQGKLIGKIVLYPNNEPLEQLIEKRKLVFFMELSALFIVVAALLFFVIKKLVISPILFLKDWSSSINTDKSLPKPKLFYNTEIDNIIDSVSRLKNDLISVREENSIISNQISEKKSLMTSIGTNLPEGMIYKLITNDTGFRKFTYLSGSFQKIYGFTPEEGIADSSLVFGRIVKEDIQSLLDAEAESGRKLTTFKCEVRMINLDGTVRVSRFVSTPTVLEDGSISWDGVELDITDLKKAQTDLEQNQFLLESITEGLPDSIFAKDLNGRYLFLNSALAKRANKTPEELLGKNNSAVFLQEDANKTLEKDLEIMRSGKMQTFEEELNTSTGSVVFLTTKGPIKDEQGKTIGVFGIARDITERKRGEEALRVSQEKFEFAFNSSPNAILIQDEQTREYLEANVSASNIFGYSYEEICSKSTLELSLYKDLDDHTKILEDFIKNGYIRNKEIIGLHKSGNDLHLLLTAERHYVNNKPFLFINIQDVTERKQVELELQKLNLDKDRFIFILGHDLKGPVNSIVGLLDIANTNFHDMQMEEIKEIIDLAYNSAKNTSKLLNDVLLWATAKSGKMNFDPQNINFRKDCQAIIELLQFTAIAKNVEIELICEDSLDVYADKSMLDAVLRNLISNALKFTHEGGKIIVSGQKKTDATVISVEDNGVGISAKDLEKIFDKMQLFTSIGTNEEKGTGFGLKLCQEFVEKHSGKIWAESEVGKGTTFFFSLPNAE